MSLFDGVGGWSPARVAELTRRWADGQSAQQISDFLGGVSREAVCGKVNRMGLPGRSKQASAVASRINRASPVSRAAKVKAQPAPRPEAPPRPVSAKFTVYEAPSEPKGPTPMRASAWLPLPGQTPAPFGDPWVCRWPIERPTDKPGEFWCCGAPRDPADSYCESHAARSGGPGKPLKVRAFAINAARARRAA